MVKLLLQCLLLSLHLSLILGLSTIPGRLIREEANSGDRRLLQVDGELDFVWSYKGPVSGKHCVQWTESSDPHTWHDNYLCSDWDYDIQWSNKGPIAGMTCTHIKESSDSEGTWHDNYLCVPASSNIHFEWSSKGRLETANGRQCVQITEPAEPTETTWHDNYLCYSWIEPSLAEDAVSIIFVSDMETDYRHNTVGKCSGVVNWIKNLADSGYTFDGDFRTIPVRPDLVIHGGDVSDGDYGVWAENKQGSNAAEYLFDNVWQQLYDAGIPMISALGNHDYPFTDAITTEANEFVAQTYAKSQDVLAEDFNFLGVQPDDGSIVPMLARAEISGVQIVNLNYQTSLSEEHFNALREMLDYDKKTIFFGHVPLFVEAEYDIKTLKADLISEFEDAIYLSGHTHSRSQRSQSGAYGTFTEYIAAYPHLILDGDTEREAGVYAVLVSPTHGVLDVKNIPIPYREVSGCLSEGTVCDTTFGTCDNCCLPTMHGGTVEYWWSKGYTACGSEPKWTDGTACALDTTCNACANEGSYWYSRAFTACGSEPKTWTDGTRCGDGTTCNVCINGFSYWYSLAITACGSEPRWGDGTICALGTTCNACQNSATHWTGKGITACGSEPCWGHGTTCGTGTTCKSCCTGNGNAYCPWFWFGVCECG